MAIKLRTAVRMGFPDGSVIYFNKTENDIMIYKAEGPISYKAEGPISRLSEEKQKQAMMDKASKIFDESLSKYDTDEEIIADIIEKVIEEMILPINDGNQTGRNTSREDKINELRQLKNKLLQEQEEVVDRPHRRERKK